MKLFGRLRVWGKALRRRKHEWKAALHGREETTHAGFQTFHPHSSTLNVFPGGIDQVTQLTPNEEDPVVHGLLANLELYAPSPGFSDRVMHHVWRPAPTWVQKLSHVFSTAFSRKRVWAVAGGLAATSAVTMVAITVTAINYWVHVETVWSVAMSVAIQLWQFSVQSTAGFTVTVMRWIAPFAIDLPMIMALSLSSTLILGLSGLGLHRTIRQYRNERVPVHARR